MTVKSEFQGGAHAAGRARSGRQTSPPGSPGRRWTLTALGLVIVLAVGAAGYLVSHRGASRGEPVVVTATPTGSATPVPAAVSGLAPIAAYRTATQKAAGVGLHVWLEADLVKRWQQSGPAFDAGVQRLVELAKEPGVVGFKVADELGYQDGMTSPDRILAFLQDTSKALRAAAPGKKILIDLIVPELGCLPGMVPQRIWASVAATQEIGKNPQLALDQVDKYVRSNTFDVLDVSTGLRSDQTYAGWGVDRDTAQTVAWTEIKRRGWSDVVTVQSRKALAEPEGYQGDATRAAADVRTWVDLPVQGGARGVDIWAWAQHYQGQTYALLAGDLRENPLWQELTARRSKGVPLFTHFTPSLTRQGLEPDLTRLATAFTDVFMATGTG